MKFQDRDFLALNPYQRAEFGLGRLFQRGGVFLSLTVPQHLTIALNGNKSGSIIKSIQKKPRDFIKESNLPELSLRLLSAAGIRANDIRLAGQLSFGQRRTLAFACIIVRKPLLLLLDEPYVGLDTNVREVVRAAIINFASKGCGVLIVEHELSETEGISNRILKMHNGKLSVVET